MGKIKVHAWDILRMIPDEEIAKIAKDTLQDQKTSSGDGTCQ